MKRIVWIIAALSVCAAEPAMADDGEFWDHAVAETIGATLPMTDTHAKVAIGASTPLDVDEKALEAIHVPAALRLDAEARFFGFAPVPSSRLLRLRGELSVGIYPDNHAEVDAFSAKADVFTYLKGGIISIGTLAFSSEKALDEQLDIRAHVFDYNVGGAVRAFVFDLSVTPLGYERRMSFSGGHYDGFYLVGLGLDMGFVLMRNQRVASLEIKMGGDIEVSLPTQKDAAAETALVLHINNTSAPIDLAAFGRFNYSSSPGDQPDFLFFNVGGRLGVRF